MKWYQFQRAAYPVIGLIVIVAIWQAYTWLSGITRIVLPSPIDILWPRSALRSVTGRDLADAR